MNNYETKLLIMRKITFNMLKPALVVLMLAFGLTSWGQGSEDFESTTIGGTYSSGSFISNGITWNYGVARNEGTFPINGKGIILQNPSTSYLEATIPGGIKDFSFQYRKAFTNNQPRQVELWINGILYEESAIFGNSTGEDNTVYDLSIYDADIDGEATVKIKIKGLTAGARQVTIDNISWTGFVALPEDVPQIEGDEFVEGKVGVDFEGIVFTTDNLADYFTLEEGTLPNGLSFNTTTGLISGIPTEAGYFSFEITATNSFGTGDVFYFDMEIDLGDQEIEDFVNLLYYDSDSPFELPLLTNAGLPITYTIGDPSIATVSGNMVTILASGVTSITAYQEGDDNWYEYENEVTLTIIDSAVLNIVISQVYGGGGNNNAPYTHDFVELYNPANYSVSLDGTYYLQYASATTSFNSNNNNNVSLVDIVMPPKSYFLIQLAGGNNGAPLPAPDATGTTILSATAGKVAFTRGIISGGNGENPIINSEYIIDLVGYGTNASKYEGSGPAPATSNTTAIFRKQGGEQDTDDNANDFVTGTPNPRNSTYGIAIWQSGAWTSVPDDSKNVIIRDELVIDGSTIDKESFEAKRLFIDSGASVTIEDGYHIKVEGAIASNNNNFTVKDGANLIQIDDDAVNTGNIKVEVTSNPFVRLEYTFWSSPIAGQGLQAFSPQTLANRIYSYNPTNDTYIQASGVFGKGVGYLFRAPNNWNDTTPTSYNGEFTGVPHNGVASIPTSIALGGYYGVGNPYPSTIDAGLFFDLNTEADVMYFWTNTNPPVGGTYEGVPNNYATYTLAGGASAAGGTSVPNGNIAVGQGFIVRTTGEDSIIFNNSLRSTNQGMFFKAMDTEKHRFWLNLSTDNTVLNQTMVAYMDGATEGFDAQIDGQMFGYYGSALYSVIADESSDYVIQGRSLPFADSDAVVLGFRAVQSGSYTISLANFDGLFTDGQDIYLKDNATEVIHDLKGSAYTFVSDEGVFNNRFEVVYKTTGDLNVNNPELNNNKWVVYSQGNGFQIETQGFEMKEVVVYDMLGRRVYNSTAEGTSHTISNIVNGVLIVKVITTDNQTLIRKTAK